MSTLPDSLKPGDPLVLASDDRNKSAAPVTVTRVGRTYVYVAWEGQAEMHDQFHRVTGVAKENTGWRRYLLTPAQYEDRQERTTLLAELRDAGIEFRIGFADKSSTELLRELHAVMRKES